MALSNEDLKAISDLLQPIKDDLQEVKQRMSNVENKVTNIELTLENEISVNIKRVAEQNKRMNRYSLIAIQLFGEFVNGI